MAAWGSVDVIVTPLSDMQLLNAANVVALIVRLPATAPAGSKLAHAARAADVLGSGLPNPPKPPPPGPRLAPGGRLNPPAALKGEG